jgi:hypothetical protein
MKAVIIETNVIAVVNQHASHVDQDCTLACIDALQVAQQKKKIVIDSGSLFFDEYFRYANRSGQPQLGDFFVKWLWDNQANVRRCERVDITPYDNAPDNFEDFPADPGLQGFHTDDRKFVAVAVASKRNPKILNAVDTDWWHFREQLKRHGISIQFLCPQLMNDE